MKLATLATTTLLLLAPGLARAQTPGLDDIVAEQEQMEIAGGYLHVLVVDGEEIKIQLNDPWAAQQPRLLGRSIRSLDAKTSSALAAAIEKYMNDTDFAAKIDDKVAHLPAGEIRNQLQFLLGEIRKGDAPVLNAVPQIPTDETEIRGPVQLKFGHPDRKETDEDEALRRQLDAELQNAGYLHVLDVAGEQVLVRLPPPMAAQMPTIELPYTWRNAPIDDKAVAVIREGIQQLYARVTTSDERVAQGSRHFPALSNDDIQMWLDFLLEKLSGEAPADVADAGRTLKHGLDEKLEGRPSPNSAADVAEAVATLFPYLHGKGLVKFRGENCERIEPTRQFAPLKNSGKLDADTSGDPHGFDHQ